MNNIFQGPAAGDLHAFLQFKRSLGYGYMRAEFTLREFDRFLFEYAARNRRWQLDRGAIAWLSSKPGRKPISVSSDAAVLRQFYRYLRRSSDPGTVAEPIWPHLPNRVLLRSVCSFGKGRSPSPDALRRSQAPALPSRTLQGIDSGLVLYRNSFWRSPSAADAGCGYSILRSLCRHLQGTFPMGSLSSFVVPRARSIPCRSPGVRAIGRRRALFRRRKPSSAAGGDRKWHVPKSV